MKPKKNYIIALTLSIIAFLFNVIFIGFNLNEKSFSYFVIFADGIPLFDYIIHAVASLAIAVSLVYLRKSKKPLLCSIILLTIAETWRALYAIITCFGIMSMSFYVEHIYNLLATVVLVVMTIISIKSNKHNHLSIIISTLGIVILAFVYFPSHIFLHGYINISLLGQYIFTYALLGLVGTMQMSDNANK